MRVIGFYTNERYRLQAEAMKASALAVGLECDLISRPDLGTYWKNCNQKCEVILDHLGNEPLLYQDADTRFVKYPKILDELADDFDFAATFYSQSIPTGGTLWFNGQRAKRYVEAWVEKVQAHPEREDDSINFRDALLSIKQAKIKHLPPAYCWYERTMRGSFPGADPVIVHHYTGAHDYPVMSIT